MTEESLYERLGGIYSIAAVVEHFAKELAKDPIAGAESDNEFISDWYANRRWREPGFIVLTTLWVSEKAGGPYKYVSTQPNDGTLDLEPTHYQMKLTAVKDLIYQKSSSSHLAKSCFCYENLFR